MNIELMLYSRGTYFLFEHWMEDRKNIYSKNKYTTQEDFLNGAGKLLTSSEFIELKKGKSIIIERHDGTAFFFKFVDIK